MNRSKKMIKYFVAYHAIDKNRKQVIGNIIATADYPISKIKDIREIEKSVEKLFDFKGVVVTNYIKL